MILIILMLVQILLWVLFYLFITHNVEPMDNWITILLTLAILLPVAGLIMIVVWWIWLLVDMSEGNIPDTKINRWLFKSNFKDESEDESEDKSEDK